MPRIFTTLIVGATMAIGLVGCGSSQSITINLSVSGVTLSMVASGDATGIAKAKSQIQGGLGSSSAANFTVVDGDSHTGAKVCETDVSDSSGTYHIVVYSDSSVITPDICTSIKSSSTSGS